MANHPSADKRNRQRITRTARNRAIESSVKTVVKRVHTALTEKNKDGATRALAIAVKALDKAATKGAIHPKAASRTVSRLSAQVHKLAGTTKAAPPKAAPSKPAVEAKAAKPAKAAAAPKKAPAKK